MEPPQLKIPTYGPVSVATMPLNLHPSPRAFLSEQHVLLRMRLSLLSRVFVDTPSKSSNTRVEAVSMPQFPAWRVAAQQPASPHASCYWYVLE